MTLYVIYRPCEVTVLQFRARARAYGLPLKYSIRGWGLDVDEVRHTRSCRLGFGVERERERERESRSCEV